MSEKPKGDYYLWHDESGLHIWASDGYDGWDEAGWHRYDEDTVVEGHFQDGINTASGVSKHQEIIDEYVVMRLAEMINEGVVEAAITRAIEAPSSRGSGWLQKALREKASQIVEALREVTPATLQKA